MPGRKDSAWKGEGRKAGLSTLNFPELPPSLRRGTRRVHLGSSASTLAIGQEADPWHPRDPRKLASLRRQHFAASNERSLSLRPFGLLATLADRIGGTDVLPAHGGLYVPFSGHRVASTPAGICYGAKPGIAPAKLPPASSAARLAARFPCCNVIRLADMPKPLSRRKRSGATVACFPNRSRPSP